MHTLGLVHTPRVGTTQVGDLNFNSLCRLEDGTIIGASESGICEIDQFDSDNGSPIYSLAELSRTDLGVPNQKRLRRMHIGLEASGLLEFSWAFDESSWETALLEGEGLNQKSQGLVVPGSRILKGRYLRVRIENVNGADFSIDSIDALISILARRKGRSRFFKPWLSEILPMLTISASGTVS